MRREKTIKQRDTGRGRKYRTESLLLNVLFPEAAHVDLMEMSQREHNNNSKRNKFEVPFHCVHVDDQRSSLAHDTEVTRDFEP